MAAAVLIIEDEAILAKNIRTFLQRNGFDAQSASSGDEGLAQLELFRPDIVLLDYNLPGMSGLEVLAEIRRRDSRVKTVMITGHGSVGIAVEAMKAGAYDYLSKPVVLSELKLLLDKAVGQERLEATVDYFRAKDATGGDLDKLLGESAPILALKDKIRRLLEAERELADNDAPAVLITGETGTGKEVVARALHFNGPRRDRPFIELNCASIPAQLIEAELFGFERGAFTDARERKQGLAEAAHGGTLFLDEIGEVDLSVQVKLLKLLEEKRVRRLGGLRENKVDVRIVAATNQDLERRVQQGQFRSDLFFRLRIVHLALPPLRERGEDVIVLARHFLAVHGARYRKPRLRFSAAAEEALRRHTWPGNVRELRNAVEQIVLLAQAELIEPGQLGFVRSASEAPPLTLPQQGVDLEEVERSLLLQALEKTGWNVSRAARLLAVSRDTLRYRMEKHRLRSPF